MYSNTMNTFGKWNSLYICTFKKKTTTTTNSGESLFFTWNFVKRLKQTFLQIDLFVACSHRARPNSATIDSFVENWEACPLPSALWLTYRQVPYTWLVCSLDHKHKGKGMWFESQQPFVGRSVAWRHWKRLCSRLSVHMPWHKKKKRYV